MRTARSLWAQRGVVALFALCASLTGEAAAATTSFHAVATPEHPIAADVTSRPTTVVGWLHSGAPRNGFRWTLEDGFVRLADLEGGDVERSEAYALSGDGRVAVGIGFGEGEVLPGSRREAVRWVGSGAPETLGVPAGSALYRSEAVAVSHDGGVVVGSASLLDTLAPDQAFRWTPAGGMQILGGITPDAHSSATAVSSDGAVVVGNTFDPLTPGHVAFRWRAETGLVVLPAIPDDAYPAGVSDDGATIVGNAAGEGFRWTESGGLERLGELPGCCGGTYAGDVSGDGSLVVGTSSNTPFLWQEGVGIRSLIEVLAEHGVGVGSWTLRSADAISSDGCVVTGSASHPQEGFGFYVAEIGCNSCRNELDDDGDGLADLDDPGCAGPADVSETDPASECDDGVDNDWDGLADFRVDGSGDPACGWVSSSESSECQDGWDNDGAPGTDFDGGASFYGVAYDDPDPDCVAGWVRREAPARCGLGFELVLLAPLLALRARRGARS